MLTRVRDCYLPSLYEACHEEPYAPGRGGFGSWPRTKWWWVGALERPGIHMLKVHRGKNLLVTSEVAAAARPALPCRAGARRGARRRRCAAAAPPGRGRALAARGPAARAGLDPKRLRALRAQLEAPGALVGRQLVIYTDAGGHQHTSELARWDQVFPEPPAGAGGLAELVVGGRARGRRDARADVGAWFHRGWGSAVDHVDALVAGGRLERPEPGWIAVDGLDSALGWASMRSRRPATTRRSTTGWRCATPCAGVCRCGASRSTTCAPAIPKGRTCSYGKPADARSRAGTSRRTPGATRRCAWRSATSACCPRSAGAASATRSTARSRGVRRRSASPSSRARSTRTCPRRSPSPSSAASARSRASSASSST